MKLLSIIIPIYNEEATLEELFHKVLDVNLKDLNYEKEIIMINDGSTDTSEEIIFKLQKEYWQDHKIKYIKNKQNSWKGFSIKEWFKNAEWDIFLIQDADLEYFPSDYPILIQAFEENNADIVYGSRTLGTKKFGNTYSSKSFLYWGLLVSIITSILSFKKVTDEPTCYKMYDHKLKKYLLTPKENWFEREPAITMLLLRKKFKYIEVPIHYKARKFDEGKKINWKDGVKAIWTLFKWRVKKI